MPIGCRSDEGLSAPVIKRLKTAPWCDVITLDLVPQQFGHSYNLTEAMLYEIRPDLVLITGDRVEMCAAAAAAFHNKVKIAHLYAGIVNDPVTTFDDVDRHCITLLSDVIMCEDRSSAIRVNMLRAAMDLPQAIPNVVGITHLDDLEIDLSKVPIGEAGYYADYDLLLLNEEPLMEPPKWTKWGKERYLIHIGGNPDGIIPDQGADEYYSSLPRPQFLGLLKNCRRFITNSSAAIYEAPYFLKPEQIVMVGQRNCNRPAVECKPGGSDRVVEVLRDYANAYMDRSKD